MRILFVHELQSSTVYASAPKLRIIAQFGLERTFKGQTSTYAAIAIPPMTEHNKVFYCDWLQLRKKHE